MKEHLAENETKTRRAVVQGRKVRFYRRPARKECYVSLKPVWHDSYRDHEQAVAAAEVWASMGKLVRPPASGATQTAKRDGRQLQMAYADPA